LADNELLTIRFRLIKSAIGGVFEVFTAGLYLSPVLVLRAHNDYSSPPMPITKNRYFPV